jgi:hypothetical protein
MQVTFYSNVRKSNMRLLKFLLYLIQIDPVKRYSKIGLHPAHHGTSLNILLVTGMRRIIFSKFVPGTKFCKCIFLKRFKILRLVVLIVPVFGLFLKFDCFNLIYNN